MTVKGISFGYNVSDFPNLFFATSCSLLVLILIHYRFKIIVRAFRYEPNTSHILVIVMDSSYISNVLVLCYDLQSGDFTSAYIGSCYCQVGSMQEFVWQLRFLGDNLL
jgi:hypothetical protein